MEDLLNHRGSSGGFRAPWKSGSDTAGSDIEWRATAGVEPGAGQSWAPPGVRAAPGPLEALLPLNLTLGSAVSSLNLWVFCGLP